MRIESSILIPLVLIVSMVSVFGYSSSKYYIGCQTFKSKEQIEIYRPNGLRVTQNSENLLGFGIKVYIYSNDTQYRTYWLYTTEVDPISKNFTLYEPMAVIREGNTLDFNIKKQYKNGSSLWYDCRRFRVEGSLIKEVQQGQIGFNNADDAKNKESQTTPPNSTTMNNTTEITNTFVLAENADVATESAIRKFIITRLTALLPSIDWNNTITEVFRWNGRFSFDVKTAEQKREILRLLEKNKNAAEVVLDFDNMEIADNNEDYDYTTDTSL